MANPLNQTGFSAAVSLYLHVYGKSLPASQVGSDFLLLESPIPLTPGPAVVEVIIDGRSFQSPTQLLFADPSTGRVILSAMNLTPTLTPTDAPTLTPTDAPTLTPTLTPTDAPTDTPTDTPLIVANDLPDRVTA